MKLLSALLLLLFVLLALFAALNWSVLAAMTPLSLLLLDVEAPLGLILLAAIAVVTALLLVYGLVLKAGMLMESRQHLQALDAQRRLADEAEQSRFTQLSEQIELRLAQLEQQMQRALDDATNSVLAQVAELDDRLRSTDSTRQNPST